MSIETNTCEVETMFFFAGIRPDVNEDGSTAVPVDHVNLTGLSTHLPCLNELRITYGSRSCGLNFDWNVHHFTLQVRRTCYSDDEP